METQKENEKYFQIQILIRLLRTFFVMDTCVHTQGISTQTWSIYPRDAIQQTVTHKECWLSSDFLKNMQKMSISLLAKQCHMGPHWP